VSAYKHRALHAISWLRARAKSGGAGSSDAPFKYKFFVYNATNDGLGNKLLPVISSFALALLSNRTLLVDWPGRWPRTNPGHVSEFLTNPFHLDWDLMGVLQVAKAAAKQRDDDGSTRNVVNDATDVIGAGVSSDSVPAGQETRQQHEEEHRHVAWPDREPLSAFEIADSTRLLQEAVGGRWEEFFLGGAGMSAADASLLCDNFDEKMANVDVVTSRSDQFFVPYLSHSPHFKATSDSWFVDGHRFGPLARTIAVPAHDIAKEVHEQVTTLMRGAHYRLGMQMRSVSWINVRQNKPQLAKFFQLARELITKHAPPKSHANVANDTTPSHNAVIFVATDNYANRRDVRRELGSLARVVWLNHETDRSTVTAIKWAMKDILMLANCDDLITTTYSTFGYTGAGYGSIYAHRVGQRGHVNRFDNAEPSAHSWGNVATGRHKNPKFAGVAKRAHECATDQSDMHHNEVKQVH
jgi:Xyloglucan fucosyltransferase